jgi:hypothetical protein
MDVLSVGTVLIGPLLILGVIGYTYVQANLENLREEWTTYRCNPIYMPFAGGIQPDVTTAQNFEYCTGMMAQRILAIMMEPVQMLFNVFAGLLSAVTNDIGYLRNFASGLISFIVSFAVDAMSKIQNTFGVLISLLARVRDLMSRIMGSAGYTAVIMITAVNFIKSLWGALISLIQTIVTILFAISIILAFVFPALLAFAIPLGAAVGISFCFHPDTLIYSNGQLVPISSVKVGDILRDGSEVTGVIKFLGTGVPMFVYEGVVVSGEHLVLEDGKWIYVRDSPKSVEYYGHNPEFIYCLNTSTHRIPIGNTIFADYEEIEEPPNYEFLDPFDTVTTALGKTPLIFTYPGMWTYDGIINAVVYLPNNRMQLFMGTPDGMFTVSGRRVRDYPDSHDPAVLARIQERVLSELNGGGNKIVVG